MTRRLRPLSAAGALLLALTLAFLSSRVASAQTAVVPTVPADSSMETTTASDAPDLTTEGAPTGAALVQQPSNDANLQEDLADIEDRVRELESARAQMLALLTFLGLSTLAGIMGLVRFIRQRAEREFWRQMNLVDPRDLTVWVPSAAGFSKERERLRLSRMRGVREYDRLEDVAPIGAVVVSIGLDPSGARNDELGKGEDGDEARFIAHVSRRQLDPESTAFILYSRDGYRISDETIAAFPNTAVANMPTTLVSAVIAVARGLRRQG